MIEQAGLQVLIRAGSDGRELRTLPNGDHTRNNEFIEVANGVPVCISIRILSTFRWSDATALSVQVKLGTSTSLLSWRILKPVEPSDLSVELETWNLWDWRKKRWTAANFEFRDLIVSSRGVVNQHQQN